jgi:hypothetical protein
LSLNIFRIQSTSTHTYCLFPTMLKNNSGFAVTTVLRTSVQNPLRKELLVEIYFNGCNLILAVRMA